MTRELDLLVVGAGPAGSLCAALCAEQGLDTLLVHRPARRHPGLSHETLVPAAVELCARHGLAEMLLREGFLEPLRHGTVWGEDVLRWRAPDPRHGSRGHGAKVAREVFDEHLREHALRRGAVIDEGGRVVAQGDRIRLERADGTVEELAPRVRVCAVGRTADAFVPCDLREDLPATLAVTLPAVAPGDFADATVIEAVRAGWLWWIPRSDGTVELTLFCDREELASTGREALLCEALASARGPARTVNAGEVSPTREGSVATVAFRRAHDERWLLIGDAASTIDPLSSQGLEKALSSGEHGALCARELLAGDVAPELVREHAWSFELGLYLAHLDRTRATYASETRFTGEPFWRARSRLVGSPPLPGRTRPAPDLRRGPTLVRRGQRLCEARGFRLADGRTVSSLGTVSIDALLALHEDGTRTLEELCRRAPSRPELRSLTPRTLAVCLTELVRLGLLVGDEA